MFWLWYYVLSCIFLKTKKEAKQSKSHLIKVYVFVIESVLIIFCLSKVSRFLSFKKHVEKEMVCLQICIIAE